MKSFKYIENIYDFMPKTARLIVEITYELPVENGYGIPSGNVTNDPEEMIHIDIEDIRRDGWYDFLEFVEPTMKIIGHEVVD